MLKPEAICYNAPEWKKPMQYDHRLIHKLTLFAAVCSVLLFTSCAVQRIEPSLLAPQEGVEAAQSPGKCLEKDCLKTMLQEALECRPGEPELRWSGLKDLSEGGLWAARASFLQGLRALEAHDSAAIDFFDASLGLPDIGDYILFYRARAYRDADILQEAVSSYDSLLDSFPDSALRPEAKFQKASTLMEAGELYLSRDEFKGFVSSYPKHMLVPDALLKSAMLSLGLNEPLEAAGAARRIITGYPAHPLARDAQALFAKLRSSHAGIHDLTGEERYQRAENLFDAARYNDAIPEYSYHAGNKKSGRYDSSVIKLAMAEMRLKRYDQADKTLRAYLSGPDQPREADALYWLALIALRQDREDTLVNIEKRLSQKFRKTKAHAGSLMFLGRYYESRHQLMKAIAAYRRVLADFKGTPSGDDALWAVGWMEYRSGRYWDAYRSFSKYEEINSAGKGLGQFLYWKARSAEKAGEAALAAALYGKVCPVSRRSFYCRMADERISALEPAPGAHVEAASLSVTPSQGLNSYIPLCDNFIQGTLAQEVADPADEHAPAAYKYCPDAQRQGALDDEKTPLVAEEPVYLDGPDSLLYKDGHYTAATELLRLGLNSRAAEELDILTRRYSNEREALYELASLFIEARDYYNALRICRLYLSGPFEESRYPYDLSALVYPRQVIELVKEVSPDPVDPHLVAAVMREESAFNPKAVSPTGALGLMQIMPSTGKVVARGLGKKRFEAKELFIPDVNIEIGSRYLETLLNRFNNDIVLAVAGYNAGPVAVSRWADTLPSELDEFIESIPYPETRNYAKRVLASYMEFMNISGEDAKAGGLSLKAGRRAPLPIHQVRTEMDKEP